MEKSVGQILKETREKRKIKLADVHKKTRISIKYLLALEEDRPDDFPGEAYFLGFLHTYAKFLGINAEELVEKYRQTKIAVVSEPVKTEEETEIPVISQPVQPAVNYWRMGILLGLFIILLGYFFSSRLSLGLRKKEKISPTLVVNLEEKKIVLEAKANADTWVRIIADGNLLYERILSTGTEKRWEAKDKFHLRVGYVPGVEMKLNGQPIDLIKGSTGQINEFDLPR